jgi:ABC-type uncharacterized transport system substrate-binding protein
MAGLLEAFQQELSKLGWIEGKNLTIEYRFAENKGAERMSELAADLVRLKVDLILAPGNLPALAAKSATMTIPIVMAAGPANPVASGSVASLARGAIMTTTTRPYFAERKRIVELAGKYRLPAIYFQKEFVDEVGLMSYGADFDDLFRRAAIYVDKILKGAKPADLPVKQPKKFEFIINLKAAKQIGLTIPPNVLVRADKVIK